HHLPPVVQRAQPQSVLGPVDRPQGLPVPAGPGAGRRKEAMLRVPPDPGAFVSFFSWLSMSVLLPPRYLPEPADGQAFSDHPEPRAPGPVGVLLINLGTPDAPEAGAIRRYLAEFLSDQRVIELPQLLW